MRFLPSLGALRVLPGLLLGLLFLVPAQSVTAQDATPTATPSIPPLTEMFEGSGRLDGVAFDYPADWTTLAGVPVNLSISFNVVSSSAIGLRQRPERDEEVILMAFAGGRINRWNELDATSTPTEIVDAFLERLGDGGSFGDENSVDEGIVFENIYIERTWNGYDGVVLRFEEVPSENPTPTPTLAPDEEPDPPGNFVIHAIKLDDTRFVAVAVLTQNLMYEDAKPTIDAILDTITFTP